MRILAKNAVRVIAQSVSALVLREFGHQRPCQQKLGQVEKDSPVGLLFISYFDEQIQPTPSTQQHEQCIHSKNEIYLLLFL